MNNAKQFIRQNKDQTKTREVHLTDDQINGIEILAGWAGVSFEDMVMILMESQLIDLEKLHGKLYIDKLSKRN